MRTKTKFLRKAKTTLDSFEKWLQRMGGLDALLRQYGCNLAEVLEWRMEDEEFQDLPPEEQEEQLNEWMYEELEEKYYNFEYEHENRGEKLELFRAMSLISVDSVRTSDFGVYWSWDADAAEAHWATTAEGEEDYVFRGVVSDSDVDWDMTLYHNLDPSTGESEKEITLKPGVVVEITGWIRGKARGNVNWQAPKPVFKTVTASLDSAWTAVEDVRPGDTIMRPAPVFKVRQVLRENDEIVLISPTNGVRRMDPMDEVAIDRPQRRMSASFQDGTEVNPIMVIVHPGSCCGSADFNYGKRSIAQLYREELMDEFDAWKGGVIIIDGELSSELPEYPDFNNSLKACFERAKSGGFIAERRIGNDPAQVQVIKQIAKELNIPKDTFFNVTGAWAYPGNEGCVGSVTQALKGVGYKAARTSKHAMTGEDEFVKGKYGAASDIEDLKRYLTMTPREQRVVYAETFWEDWMEFTDEAGVYPDDAPDDVLEDFEESTYRIFKYERPQDCPAWMYLTYKRMMNGWVAHFSDHAHDIAENGFTHGIADINKLGLTQLLGEDKSGGGYVFGFPLDKGTSFIDGKVDWAWRGYGKGLVLARVKGVVVDHDSDGYDQAIFWGADAKNITEVERLEEGWVIKGQKVGSIDEALAVAKGTKTAAEELPYWDGEGRNGEFPGYEPGGRLSRIRMEPIAKLRPTEESLEESKVEDIMEELLHGEENVPAIIVQMDWEGNYDIVDGHHRYEAAKRLGYTEVPVREWMDPDQVAERRKETLTALQGDKTAASLDLDLYTHGRCHIFALALHKALKYPMEWVINSEEDDNGDTLEVLEHAYCVRPNGTYVDAGGTLTSESLSEDFSAYGLSEYAETLRITEPEMNRYVSEGFVVPAEKGEIDSLVKWINQNLTKYQEGTAKTAAKQYPGAEIIATKGRFAIYLGKTPEAAEALSKGTNWTTGYDWFAKENFEGEGEPIYFFYVDDLPYAQMSPENSTLIDKRSEDMCERIGHIDVIKPDNEFMAGFIGVMRQTPYAGDFKDILTFSEAIERFKGSWELTQLLEGLDFTDRLTYADDILETQDVDAIVQVMKDMVSPWPEAEQFFEEEPERLGADSANIKDLVTYCLKARQKPWLTLEPYVRKLGQYSDILNYAKLGVNIEGNMDITDWREWDITDFIEALGMCLKQGLEDQYITKYLVSDWSTIQRRLQSASPKTQKEFGSAWRAYSSEFGVQTSS